MGKHDKPVDPKDQAELDRLRQKLEKQGKVNPGGDGKRRDR